VDGFNLYYGAVKGTPYKWLNPVELINQLIPSKYILHKVKHFTARVSGAADPDAPRRQHAYLGALSTLAEIELYYGRFLSKSMRRPVINFPVANAIINSPTPACLPDGIHIVSGGSLTIDARLAVRGYPLKGAARQKRAPRAIQDALITEVHTMEEKGSDVNLAAHLLNDAWKDAFDVTVCGI